MTPVFSRLRESRGASVVALLVGLVLFMVGAWAISLPISGAVSQRLAQRRADDVARLPVIASAAQLAEAKDGDEVLFEGRISPSNSFTVLRTWRRQNDRYVVYDGNFAAYWTQHVRPTEGGVTFDPDVIPSVPEGLRVQVASGTEIVIDNADFKTALVRSSGGSILGRDLPPLIDLVTGFELDELVTVHGRLRHRGGRRTMEAEYLLDTTSAEYVRFLRQTATEAGALTRGFSDAFWAVTLVVGVPCVIGGIFLLRWSYKNLFGVAAAQHGVGS